MAATFDGAKSFGILSCRKHHPQTQIDRASLQSSSAATSTMAIAFYSVSILRTLWFVLSLDL